MRVRSHNFQGGITIISFLPLGVRVGMTWITPQEYARRKNKQRQELERFQKVKIPKSCGSCGIHFDIETFPKCKGRWLSVCKECKRKRDKSNYYKYKELNNGKSNMSKPKKQVSQYKIVCRGTGMAAKKEVTIKARSEAEARQKVFEIGLIPFEVL